MKEEDRKAHQTAQRFISFIALTFGFFYWWGSETNGEDRSFELITACFFVLISILAEIRSNRKD